MNIDSQVNLNIGVTVLPKGEWEFHITQHDDGSGTPELIRSIPGTWIEPKTWMNKRIIAAYSCPNCHSIRLLVKNIHTISNEGLIFPDLQCKAQDIDFRCTYNRKTYLDRWNKKPLYACAVEVLKRNKRIPQIVYTHATTPAEALKMLGPTVDGCLYDIVAIGPAIGFFVEDGKDDTKLSAS